MITNLFANLCCKRIEKYISKYWTYYYIWSGIHFCICFVITIACFQKN